MKWALVLIIIMTLGFGDLYGEDFLGVPLIPSAKVVEKTERSIKLDIPLSHDQILNFYKETLKDEKDIKYRDWKDMTYIEDDGARPWHSINIYKNQGAQTTVEINKDSWSWIIGTLILRFIGVFAVLVVLLIALAFAGLVLSRLFKEQPNQAR